MEATEVVASEVVEASVVETAAAMEAAAVVDLEEATKWEEGGLKKKKRFLFLTCVHLLPEGTLHLLIHVLYTIRAAIKFFFFF